MLTKGQDQERLHSWETRGLAHRQIIGYNAIGTPITSQKKFQPKNKCSSDHSRICKPVVGVEIIVVCLGFLKVFCTWAGGLNLEESTSEFKKLNKNHHNKKFSFYAKSFYWYKQINMDMLLQRFAFLILKNSAYGILLLLLLNFHRRKPL